MATTALTAGVLGAVSLWPSEEALALCLYLGPGLSVTCSDVTNTDVQFTPMVNDWTATLVEGPPTAAIQGDDTLGAALDIINDGDWSGTVTLQPNTEITGNNNPGILLRNAKPLNSTVVFDIDGHVGSNNNTAIRIENGFNLEIDVSADSTVIGGGHGIEVFHWSGALEITNDGLIEGDSSGILAGGVVGLDGSVEITNASTGSIVGGADGILVGTFLDDIAIDNSPGGLIEGTTGRGVALFVFDNGVDGKVRIDNSGTSGTDSSSIAGGEDGVWIDGFTTNLLQIDNRLGGSIQGETGSGIEITDGTFVGGRSRLVILNDDLGTIFGGETGIEIAGLTGGDAILIDNSDLGSIAGETSHGIAIDDVSGVNLLGIGNSATGGLLEGGEISGNGGNGVRITNVDFDGASATLGVFNSGTDGTDGGSIFGEDTAIAIDTVQGINQLTIDNVLSGEITSNSGHVVDIRNVAFAGPNTTLAIDNSGTDGTDGGLIGGGTGSAIAIADLSGLDLIEIDNALGGEVIGTQSGVFLPGNDADIAIDNTGGGLIQGNEFHGIHAGVFDNGAAGQVQVDNSDGGSILGAGVGILVNDFTTGLVSIDNSLGGSIEAETNSGIAIVNGLGVDLIRIDNSTRGEVIGAQSGIFLPGNDAHIWVVNTDRGGIVGEQFHGVHAVGFDNGADGQIRIDNLGSTGDGTDGGFLLGGLRGVWIETFATKSIRIDNSLGGQIQGLADHGIAITDGTFAGAGSGLEILNNGDAGTRGGTITGAEDGIAISGISGIEQLLIENSFGGSVVGEAGTGIDVSGIDGDVLILNEGGTVEGGVDGISVAAVGSITVSGGTGSVTATTGTGMLLESSGGSIGVVTGGVDAELDGVNATAAAGQIAIAVVVGEVSSKSGDGVEALSLGTGPVLVGVAVDGSIAAAESAIEIEIQGSNGDAKATVLVEEEIAGGATGLGDATILSTTVDGTAIGVDTDGVVTGNGGAVDALIVNVDGGAAVIDNFGTMVGRLDLTDEADLFRNWSETSWTTSGTTDFGAGFDQLDNPGRIEVVDTAEFANLELLNNFDPSNPVDVGILDMADGDTGEVLLTTSGDYDGGNGSLAQMDVDIDPVGGSASDLFVIGGGASGVTWVEVQNLGGPLPVVFDPLGTLLVDVNAAGSAEAEAFQLLGGPVDVGFFTWDIHFVDPDNDFFLRSGLNARAFEPPALVSGAQEAWHQSNQTWLDRTADLRIFTNPGVGTMDAAENRAEGGYSDGSPGIWVRGFGSWLDRDADHVAYGQNTYGAQAGMDFAVTEPNAEGGTFIVGALAGYLWSEIEFDESGSSADLEGPQVGLYATYLNGGFFGDLLVKAEFLELDYETGFGGDDSDSADVLSIGAVADMGYRFDFEQFFIEPGATLAYVHTDVDDMDLLGVDVSFDDDASLRGRLGLRAGARFQPSSAFVIEPFLTASLWHEFLADNAAVLSSSGSSVGVSDDAGDTWVEVGGGVNVVDFGSGVSGFVKGDYRFAGDTDGFAVQAGVRVNF